MIGENRTYFTLFNPSITTPENFIEIVENLLADNPNIHVDSGGKYNTIKITIPCHKELGRYFTEQDYNFAKTMENTNHPTEPMLAGMPGSKLVLIISCWRAQNHTSFYQQMINMTNEDTFPQHLNGFLPELVTAFLTD